MANKGRNNKRTKTTPSPSGTELVATYCSTCTEVHTPGDTCPPIREVSGDNIVEIEQAPADGAIEG